MGKDGQDHQEELPPRRRAVHKSVSLSGYS